MANEQTEPTFEPPTTPSPSSIEYVEKSGNGPHETR